MNIVLSSQHQLPLTAKALLLGSMNGECARLNSFVKQFNGVLPKSILLNFVDAAKEILESHHDDTSKRLLFEGVFKTFTPTQLLSFPKDFLQKSILYFPKVIENVDQFLIARNIQYTYPTFPFNPRGGNIPEDFFKSPDLKEKIESFLFSKSYSTEQTANLFQDILERLCQVYQIKPDFQLSIEYKLADFYIFGGGIKQIVIAELSHDAHVRKRFNQLDSLFHEFRHYLQCNIIFLDGVELQEIFKRLVLEKNKIEVASHKFKGVFRYRHSFTERDAKQYALFLNKKLEFDITGQIEYSKKNSAQ